MAASITTSPMCIVMFSTCASSTTLPRPVRRRCSSAIRKALAPAGPVAPSMKIEPTDSPSG